MSLAADRPKTAIKTIHLSPYHQIQGEHVGTLPNGRVSVRVGTPDGAPCKWKSGFLFNYCSLCKRDEGDMMKCPKARSADEIHTGREIERTVA